MQRILEYGRGKTHRDTYRLLLFRHGVAMRTQLVVEATKQLIFYISNITHQISITRIETICTIYNK